MTEGTQHQGFIVVGVDGSPESLKALEWAASYASAFSLRVDALIAWHLPTNYDFDLPVNNAVDQSGEAETELAGAIAEVRRRHPGVVFEEIVADDRAASALIKASERAELLVVGSRGRGAFAGMLLGSVSTHCVHQAACPVVVVR